MKRILVFFCIVICTISCDRNHDGGSEGGTIEDLGEFQVIAAWIDMTQDNQFQESLLYNDWRSFRHTVEVYEDGSLKETLDWTESGGVVELSINENHTIGNDGTWMYAHNLLLIKNGGSYGSWEVANVSHDHLHLKNEIYPVGGEVTPFFKDKSGKHEFYCIEFCPREK